MSSQVDICNAALTRVGAPRITSITDNTESALSCNAIWDLCLNEILNAGDWSCTITRVALAQLGTAPVYGWNYQYTLPSDCFKVIDVDSAVPNGIPYAIEQGVLLSNDTPISIRYVAKLADIGNYDAGFVGCLVDKLALELSWKFVGDVTYRNELKQTYKEDLAQNLAQDALQGTADDTYIADLLDLR